MGAPSARPVSKSRPWTAVHPHTGEDLRSPGHGLCVHGAGQFVVLPRAVVLGVWFDFVPKATDPPGQGEGEGGRQRQEGRRQVGVGVRLLREESRDLECTIGRTPSIPFRTRKFQRSPKIPLQSVVGILGECPTKTDHVFRTRKTIGVDARTDGCVVRSRVSFAEIDNESESGVTFYRYGARCGRFVEYSIERIENVSIGEWGL
mmetsp:Transcript_38124/g.113934  ORF Transcript_38124/g.113934 Transcript_38124/m.113934 type:complete len:204 (+) Transcript_38124:328-939(+)